MNLGSARFLFYGVTFGLLLTPFLSADPLSPANNPAVRGLAMTGLLGGFSVTPQDTGKPTIIKLPGGKLSRRARAAQQREAGRGGDVFRRDTSRALIDSILALPRDSSARLEQFKHVRRDELVASDKGKTQHTMYLPDPAAITYKEVLDSIRWSYRIRELLGTIDIRLPVDLSLEEYSTLRLQRNIRKNWALMAQAYEFGGEKKAGLGELFGKVTNIEIPVPKNPLFSIFGPNIIRIQINGAVDIHTAFRNTTSDLLTNSPLGQSRNEPDFNQEVQVSVKGEIGDKLKIDADWNTQRTFEYENQLKVRYTGYEDEIVQSVEAGNVSLPTSSAFISSSQALFGVKAGFQFGPLRLTTVATQKKGQIKELSVSGGSRPTPFEIRPVNYATNHFFVDTSYIGLYEQIFLKIPAVPDLDKQITDLEVWVTNISTPDPNRDRDGIAFISQDTVRLYQSTVEGRTQEHATPPGDVEVGRFNKLEPTDYTYNPYAGVISLNKSLDPSQVVAVAYLRGDGATIGTFNARDTLRLVLKLVRPKNLGPQFKTAWKLMLKNHYPLGGTGIKSEGFELRVEYELPSQPPFKSVLPQNIGLLEMFGLDRFVGTDNAQAGHDQTFDYLSGLTIDEARGELIFPTVEPFDAPSIAKFLSEKLDAASAKTYADSFSFRSLYDTTYYGALNSNRNLYFIRGTIKPSTASTYNLGFNIVEGSVQVVVDGVTATPNVDYTVDYITGQVVIKNQSFLVPGKNLQIKYEANDLFQLASKSLVGARGDFNLGKNSTLGFTFMNLNQQSLSDKVRLGEEPISNSIMGIDGGTTVDMDFLTRAMNWIPGIRTTAPSQFSIRGEAAYMLPDPNTRKSSIPQDHGSGMAYIDDFEGALRQIPLGIGYTIWRESSPPYYVNGLDPAYTLGIDRKIPTDLLASQVLADTSKMWYKAKMTWFNVIPTDVITSTIWGNRKSVAKGQDQVTVLNLYFKPQMRGAFNYSMNLDSTLFADPKKAWGGIQHLIGTTSTNLLDENISFIELWVKIVRSPAGAKLNINLGYISEDVVPTPSNVLNTEDAVHGGIRTGYLKPGEDVGLDGLTDDEERSRYATFLEKYAQSHPEYASDPSGDNWTRPPFGSSRSIEVDPSTADQYLNANGTEGNSGSELGARFPDTEDLNGNNALDRANAYFEYELPLDTTNADFQKYVTGFGQSGWYQVRIPLNDFARQIGSPTFTNVESVRLWLTGAQSDVLLRMTEFNLIGNQWEELVKNDPQFKVSVVNVEDNPDYQSPVEGLRTRDPAHPDQVVYSNEQSLNLVIRGLADGEVKEAIKRFVVKPLDLFNYRSLKMFVHGEEGDVSKGYQRFQFVDTTTYTVEMFLRFGSDSLNYYEYRLPVRTGWDQANDITINFADLTAIKFLRDSGSVYTHRVRVPGTAPGVTYQIRGDPTLTNVRYVSIGVQNPTGKTVPGSIDVVNGELWVDELRLTDVDNTPGLAYRFDSSIKLADVANLTFSYTDRDPNFHALEERFGSRSTTRNWGLTANIGFERFLPESWNGSSLAFSYSHVEATAQPRYVPGTDILVDAAAQRVQEDTTQANPSKAAEAVRVKSEDLSVTETYALPNIKLNIPSGSWLITETINRLTLGYSYNVTTRRSPTIEYSEAWGWNARANYGLQFGANFLEPLSFLGDFFLFSPWKNARIYFTPRQIALTASMARSQSRDRARNQAIQNPTVRNLSASRAMNFNWQVTENGLLNVGTDYQLDIQSSLVHLELDRLGNQRSFSDILGDMFLNDRLVNFGNDLSYSQAFSFSSKPVVPSILKLDKIIIPSLRYNVGYNWSNNLQAGELGKSAQWNATFNATTDISIKTISEQIWPSAPTRVDTETPDSLVKSLSALDQFDRITRALLKNTLFDFEKLGITFTQTTRAQNSGVLGRPGFGNLFNRIPFFQSSTVENGPSLYYQLGLSPDPHGDVILKAKRSFPFFTGYSVPGLRARNGSLTDVYSQTNRITMRTSRGLWEGAQLELNWNVGWSYNENKTIVTDTSGNPFERSRVVTGDIDRSFMSFPPVLLFKLFHTGIEDVDKRYEALKFNKADPRADDAKLSQAFVEGLEAFPVITKILGSIAPRANWSIRWDGLEKFSLFKSFAQRVSLDHSYTSSYRRRWRISQDGAEVTESQSVTYGFSPLLGASFTFKELFKGNFGATVRYNTTTSFDLNPSVQNVSEGGTSDISVTANYSRQGFEIPFFGLSLSNDLDISFSYTYSLNARKIYDMKEFRPEGTPQEGSTRTVMEPRIRYILSSRVTASLYYRYTKIAPYQGVSKIPGSTINEGGLDVHVAIQ